MKHVIVGLVLIAAGWALRSTPEARLATGPLKGTFVDARAAETAAHQDGPADFTRSRLTELARRLDESLTTLPLLLGLAILVSRLMRRSAPGVSPAWSVAILMTAMGSGLVLTEQAALVATGWKDGLFTEDDSARDRRFFGERVVRAAAQIEAAVPPDARVLVIRIGVPRDLNALGYLIFPRRIFMLPDATLQLDADQMRELIEDWPDAISSYEDAGYTHAINLLRLIEEDDPRAIVPFSGGE